MCPSLICSHGKRRETRWRRADDLELEDDLREFVGHYSDLACSNFLPVLRDLEKRRMRHMDTVLQNDTSFVSSLGMPSSFCLISERLCSNLGR